MSFSAGHWKAAGGVRPAAERSPALNSLRWRTTFVPAAAIFLYETLRHGLFEHAVPLPHLYGNLLTGAVALVLCFLFSRAVFKEVAAIQRSALEETRRAAMLASMVEERERLSRELHDGLAQIASYVLVRLDTIRNLIEEQRAPEAVAELESLRGAAEGVNADVREAISGLRSSVAERGLAEAVKDYLEAFEERHHITTRLHRGPGADEIPPFEGAQVFRVIQEALTNVRKHAGAATVDVEITRGSDLHVRIVDDGSGFSLAEAESRPQCVGLASMRERVHALAGAVAISSVPGHGTAITLTVPLPPA